jgi:hypothetical protein
MVGHEVVAKKRRPQRQQIFGLDPIAVAEMNAALDYSIAERLDGPTASKYADVGRKRTRHTEPINLGDLDYFAAYVVYEPLWDFAEEIAGELENRVGPGRPREYEIHSVIMADVMLYQKFSVRRAFRSLDSPLMWDFLRREVERAWPNHPERRFCDSSLGRDQYNRGRQILIDQVFCYLDRLREHCQETQLGIARLIGCFVDDDSLTHPSKHNMIYGDATWLESLYRSNTKGFRPDPETGEIVQRRFDPDAEIYRDGSLFPGNYWVSAVVRTSHPHERVILDAQFKPEGIGDGGVFTNMVLPIIEAVPEVRGVGYDMALHPPDQDRILDTGRHVLAKTSLTNKGKRAQVPLGAHVFKDGTREMTIAVTAIDGTPGIATVVAGQRMWQPLERVQTIRRNSRLYGHWRIPDHEAVSAHLRALVARIRHSSTDDERANGKRRTRALRTIPPTDTDWRELFGGREDTESMHNNMKEKWFGKRVRAVGLERREMQLRGYQIHQGITALLAWHYRTGGDISRYFGEWKPPNRQPVPRT